MTQFRDEPPGDGGQGGDDAELEERHRDVLGDEGQDDEAQDDYQPTIGDIIDIPDEDLRRFLVSQIGLEHLSVGLPVLAAELGLSVQDMLGAMNGYTPLVINDGIKERVLRAVHAAQAREAGEALQALTENPNNEEAWRQAVALTLSFWRNANSRPDEITPEERIVQPGLLAALIPLEGDDSPMLGVYHQRLALLEMDGAIEQLVIENASNQGTLEVVRRIRTGLWERLGSPEYQQPTPRELIAHLMQIQQLAGRDNLSEQSKQICAGIADKLSELLRRQTENR